MPDPIKHHWDAIEQENSNLIKVFENGDTKKEFLARSRYLLYKSRERWSESQKQRAEILFTQYPDLKHAYSLTHGLRKSTIKTLQKP